MYSMQAMDMPISKPTEPAPAASNPQAYQAERAAFKARHVSDPGIAGAVQAFHAVRNLPYFSGPDRTPLAALRNGRGACTAKHMLLRDLLRDLGYRADVELVDCDFAAAVPLVPAMPDELRAFVRTAGVRDIHCWVRLHLGGQGVLLDATWPDSLATHGFAVNAGWTGAGETGPAAKGIVRATAEDVLEKKAELLAELAPEETQRRKAFLGVLSAWLEEMSVGHEGGTT
jgi:hypothetical protein